MQLTARLVSHEYAFAGSFFYRHQVPVTLELLPKLLVLAAVATLLINI